MNNGPQQGRNEVCSCGSGKKFKKCCGLPKNNKSEADKIEKTAAEKKTEVAENSNDPAKSVVEQQKSDDTNNDNNNSNNNHNSATKTPTIETTATPKVNKEQVNKQP